MADVEKILKTFGKASRQVADLLKNGHLVDTDHWTV